MRLSKVPFLLAVLACLVVSAGSVSAGPIRERLAARFRPATSCSTCGIADATTNAKPAPATAVPTAVPGAKSNSVSDCPDGKCPTQSSRRRIFGR